MRSDKASSNREHEYQNLIVGISENQSGPQLLKNASISPPLDSKVDPYQDPAYNQPHDLIENMVVASSESEDKKVEALCLQNIPLSPALQACIDECFKCHKICLSDVARVYKVPESAVSSLPRLMINCAKLCATSAHFMLTASPFHRMVCDVCATVCEACAKGCDEIGNLAECAAQCRSCAGSCRFMASMTA